MVPGPYNGFFSNQDAADILGGHPKSAPVDYSWDMGDGMDDGDGSDGEDGCDCDPEVDDNCDCGNDY